jgi:outer membrane protein assembly factor BamB
LSADGGEERWRFPLDRAAPGHFTIDRRRAYVWTAAEELSAVDLTSGQVEWSIRVETGTAAGLPVAAGDLLLVTGTKGMALYDAPTGTRLWQVKPAGSPRGAAIFVGPDFLISIDDRIELRRLADGQMTWQAAVGHVDHPLIAERGQAVVCTRSGQLKLLSLQGGHAVRTLPCEPGRWPPLVHQGVAVFRQPERWYAWELTELEGAPLSGLTPAARRDADASATPSEPWEWFITFGGDVQPSTPLVGVAGAIAFADQKGGVVCVRPTR